MNSLNRSNGILIIIFIGILSVDLINGFISPRKINCINNINSRQHEEKENPSLVILFNTKKSNDSRRGILEVPYGEDSRRYRRTIYNADLWINHRSPDRFVKNLNNIFVSGIARQLVPEVITVTSVATLVCLWNILFVDGYSDFSNIHHDPVIGLSSAFKLVLPTAPFQTSTSALGLLLVFRTNTSYFRWNEARSAWGRIINQSRNVMRQGAAWTLPDTNPHDTANPEYFANPMSDDERLEKIMNLSLATWSVSRSLCRHLLSPGEDEGSFVRDIRERLDASTAESLIASRHRPQRALYYLSNCVDELPLDFRQRYEIDKCLVVLIDMIGTCERLYTAPIPLFYTRHACRFLSTWLLLLPFAFYEPFEGTWNHFGMIPCIAIMSFFFFGVEELAVQLEEPFSLLPMAEMSEGIGLSANEFLQWYKEDCDSFRDQQKYNPFTR